MDDFIEIYYESDSDYDEYSDYIPIMVKREYSESIYDGSKVDSENNQYDVFIEDLNDEEETKYPCLVREHMIRT